MEARVALQAFTPAQLVERFPALTPSEARKAVAMIHRDEPLVPREGLRRSSVEALRALGEVPALQVLEEQRSQVDPFVKYVLGTADGHRVETVRIPLHVAGRFSVCVSSQVGCAMACAFCATGRLGLLRNLHAWEMVEQVRVVRRRLPEGRVHGLVFQGMGEPLNNLDRVITAIRVLNDPCAQSIDARTITVCTSGSPAGIRRLALELPKVRLGLSVGSARPHVRRALMPIDATHPLDDVMDAAVEHARVTGLSPMWAVTLLEGVNDSVADATALAQLARTFQERSGRWPRVSVVPYNRIAEDGSDPFRRVSDDTERAYRDAAAQLGVFTHKRYSGGADVSAACGQLASTAATEPGRTLRPAVVG